MKDEIKEVQLTARVPVIRAPELIKVRTISPKIVDQMPWVTTSADWTGLEIVGRLPGGVTVVRHSQTGKLSRVADQVYLDKRAKELEQFELMAWPAARDKVQAELDSLPQIFGV